MYHAHPAYFRGLLPIALLILVGSIALGQSTPTNPQDKPHKQRKEGGNPIGDWAEKDVGPIITPDELKAWKKLKTDEEREAFIGIFWDNRDPNPDTAENEYREAYYERMSYVNENFSSGRPGYMTDRGRIYLKWGKPDEVEAHPAGGAYERPSYQGGGSTSTYPFEIWFYRHIPNASEGVELEFVDRTGSGEYRLANSPDEKDAFLTVPGAGNTLAEIMGTETRADRILGRNTSGYQREQDSPFGRILTNYQVTQAPPVDLRQSNLLNTDSGAVDSNNQIAIDIRTDLFRQSDRSAIAAITVQTSNRDLKFISGGGTETARLNIFGRIRSVSNRVVATFEDSVSTYASETELAAANARHSAYQKVIPLPPGTYKVDVIVRDMNSSAIGHQQLGFTVPRYSNDMVSLSSLVLASRLEELGAQPSSGMFNIGDKKVVPNLGGQFHQGESIGVYAQIYNAGIDETTLLPSVNVNYSIRKNGIVIFRQPEDWRNMSDAGQRLTLARILPTTGLAPGNYQIAIDVRDHVSGQTLTSKADFTIIK